MAAALPEAPALAEARLNGARCLRRAVELIVVFFLAPLLFVYGIVPMRFVMPMLLALAIAAIALIRGSNGDPVELGISPLNKRHFIPVIFTGLGIWLVALVGTLAAGRPGAAQSSGFSDHPQFVLLICIIYPASAAAQELLFRSFFFWRYKGLAPLPVLALINVLAFGWVHIIFGSWTSVWLTIAGGAVFTALYLWRRNLGAIIFIHSMVGLSAFLTGYGHYFYHGARPLH